MGEGGTAQEKGWREGGPEGRREGLMRSAKDHTTEVGPISVLSHGGREFNSLFVKHWRLTHQQRLG